MALGIIAGKGSLPYSIACSAQLNNHQVYIVALEGFAAVDDFPGFNSIELKIGQVKKIFEFFTHNHVTDVVLVGKVERPKWSNLYVDKLGRELLMKLVVNKIAGDDTLLSIVSNFLEQNGFRVRSPLDFWQNHAVSTKVQPSKNDLEDIKLGLELIDAIGSFDVGQSIIVEKGYIIGIEAAEGTDELIKRTSEYKRFFPPSGILIKSAKPQQNFKLDLPTIGPTTVQNVINYGFKGIAFKKNNFIILEAEEVTRLADKSNIFIHEV